MTFECDTTWVCLLHKVWFSYPDEMRFIQGVSQRQLLKQSWKHSKSCCLKLNLVLTSIPAAVFRLKHTRVVYPAGSTLKEISSQPHFLGFVPCSQPQTALLQSHYESALPERLASEGQHTLNIHSSALWTGYSRSWLIFGTSSVAPGDTDLNLSKAWGGSLAAQRCYFPVFLCWLDLHLAWCRQPLQVSLLWVC